MGTSDSLGAASEQLVEPKGDAKAIYHLMALTRASRRLDVVLTDSAVTIRFLGETRGQVSARLDNRAVASELPDGQRLETKARFDAGKGILVIERSVKGAGTVEETYSTQPQDEHLVVDIVVNGGPEAGWKWHDVYGPAKR